MPTKGLSSRSVTTATSLIELPRKSWRSTEAAARVPEVIETEIAAAEKELRYISEKMSQPEVARDSQRLQSLNQDYEQTDARLRQLYLEWEQLSAETTGV